MCCKHMEACTISTWEHESWRMGIQILNRQELNSRQFGRAENALLLNTGQRKSAWPFRLLISAAKSALSGLSTLML